MTEMNGKRHAIRRATSQGTLVTCESCGMVKASPLAASKAISALGWWRPDHDMILCHSCYVPPSPDAS